MSTTTKLSNDASKKDIEQKLYRSMIGSLLYLIVSHPNISFSVGACARYQANPKESHLTSIKRIIRYKNVEDRKMTFGACFFVSDCLVA